MNYKIVSVENVKEHDLIKVSVDYLDNGTVIHKNDHFMQIAPTGIRMVVDVDNNLITESGTKVAPDNKGSYPDEDPKDPYQRENFNVDVKAVITENIEGYLKRNPDLTKKPFDYRDPRVAVDANDPKGLITNTVSLVGKETIWQS